MSNPENIETTVPSNEEQGVLGPEETFGSEDSVETSDDKQKLINQVVDLQGGLKALIQRVETIKQENDQMQAQNQILQTYINNLMSSNVLSSSSVVGGNVGGGVKKEG
ncbi:hypothetical protein G9A89_002936 [Geosiphon pyriformis]|nr:hypothetical protein G9A89_002936 [Geosiphon pyriformis]